MIEKLLGLKAPLNIKDIDFRIQSINNGKYATILAYKDARVDMNRLDEVVGSAYWKREHFDNNTRCKVSVWNDIIKEWVSKEDIGTASQTEAEKGTASDSFKRACFNWGIGRELYDYPVISVKLLDDEVTETGRDRPKYKATFNLKLKEWTWNVMFMDGKLSYLSAIDNNNIVRFTFGIPPISDDNFSKYLEKILSEGKDNNGVVITEAYLKARHTLSDKQQQELANV